MLLTQPPDGLLDSDGCAIRVRGDLPVDQVQMTAARPLGVLECEPVGAPVTSKAMTLSIPR